MTLPYDYGKVNPLETTARYTSVEEVRGRLRIPDTNLTFDERILRCIIAAEYGIDANLGRSFPDGPGTPDVTQPGPVQGIPEAVKEAATSVAVSVYKAGDAPTGVAGSDAFIGELDLAELVRTEINRSPILNGLRVAWGLA